MSKPLLKIPKKYLSALKINGLSGRLLKIPSQRKISREILLVYDRGSNLESAYELAVELSKYGNVSMPDLPGFGGMDSFYTIGEEPSIDTLAEYLAGFCKFYYRNKPFSLVGYGFGMMVATRMLQRFPDIAARVNMVVSIGGFSSKRDLKLPTGNIIFGRSLSTVLSGNITSAVVKRLLLNKLVLVPILFMSGYRAMSLTARARLLKVNDLRTMMRTHTSMRAADLTDWQVPAKIHHIHFSYRRNPENVKNSLEQIYKKVYEHKFTGNFVASPYISREQAELLLPATARRLLARKPAKK